ncbi:HAD family hydrolase [Salipaludibacillus sp. CF4.18]|uniref:HAD family hydrolase n=1 Tax=Salipaludibacillus sp. CF4.18 TaxID=3373081 RepID=UPI003EE494E7
MIKAVVFDLDGTLLNRDASVRVFIDKQYERLNKWLKHIPKDKYINRFIELDHRGYVWKDKVYKHLVEEFKIVGITWEEFLQDYINQFQLSCVPFSNLVSMLEELKNKNLSLGMITNGKGQFQMNNITALGIEKYFDTILISEWEGMKKPEPQIFNKVLSQLKVRPKESVYIGDHPINDVKTARNAGMKSIWKQSDQWDNVKADFIVSDLKDIPFIVSRLSSQNVE